MTGEEYIELARRLGAAMLNLEGATIDAPDGSWSFEVSERETIALGVGVAASDTFLRMSPPKPVSDFDDGDIQDLVKMLLSEHADLILSEGLVSIGGDGDAKEA